MVTGDARVAPRSSLVMVERFTPLSLASSIWVSCFRWRSFFRLLSLRTLQILLIYPLVVHRRAFVLPESPVLSPKAPLDQDRGKLPHNTWRTLVASGGLLL